MRKKDENKPIKMVGGKTTSTSFQNMHVCIRRKITSNRKICLKELLIFCSSSYVA